MKKATSIISFIVLLVCLFSCEDEKPIDNKKTTIDTVITKEPIIKKIDQKKVSDSIKAPFKIKELTKALEQQFKSKKLNGCVYIQQAGLPLIEECVGNTCFKCDNFDSLTSTSVFQLASVSKTFTAAAILKLIEQKKLSLIDSVQKHYPSFPFHGVTIEHLLSHRSGLPNYLYTFEDSSKTCDYPSNQKLMHWFSKIKNEKSILPGKHFSYNNSNYAILAALIEKSSGMTYGNYLHHTIFKPLNMTHTFMVNAIPDSVTKTIGHERKKEIKKDFFDEIYGDKGIYSCTNDLLIWYKSLMNNTILSKESIQQAFTPRSFEKPGVRNYGLGFRIITDEKTKKHKFIYHNGWWKGYSTLFWFDPQTEVFICILSNERNKSTYHITELIEILNEVTF